MATVSEVPDVTREKMAVGTGHTFLLERLFHLSKATAKRLSMAFFAILYHRISMLRRSDPVIRLQDVVQVRPGD